MFSAAALWRFLCRFLMVAGLVAAPTLHAQDHDEAIAAIRLLLTTTQPGMDIHSIEPSVIPGLYEVAIQQGQTLYVTADARYLIPGDLYEAAPQGLVNLGEERRNVERQKAIAALDENDMIIFPAKGEAKATLTVFTDVDCPYCRQLHGEIDELNEYGITIRYLAFPRTGLNTDIHRKMISTWCAENRKAMFTAAKRGADIPLADCDDPVAEHYELGRELGVTGTPALVFEDGSLLPGYIPAATLANYLLSGE
jgi:thiol:disulfide interchange protein DsbC